MENFVILLLLLGAFVALIAFIVGLFSPKTVKCKTRGKVTLVYLTSSILLLYIMGWCVPDSEPVRESQQAPTPTAQEPYMPIQEAPVVTERKTPKQEIESSLGKPIEIGNFIYTIQSVSFRKTVGDEYFEETADGIYMLVNLSIKNISSETRTLDGSLFAVTDINGTKYEFSTDASTALEMSGRKTLFLKECQPNITTKGCLVFEVPQKGDYYLHLIGSFWGTNSVRVLLR